MSPNWEEDLPKAKEVAIRALPGRLGELEISVLVAMTYYAATP